MLELINKIRKDPVSYADIVENNINNIIELHSSREDAPKFVFKKKVQIEIRHLPGHSQTHVQFVGTPPLIVVIHHLAFYVEI